MKKNEIAMLLVCFLLFVGCTGRSKSDIYSQWSLQARSTGQYLYEENGSLKMGERVEGDRYLWVAEALSGEGVRLKNKHSGRYLQTAGDSLVCGSAADLADPAVAWRYEGFGIRQMQNCSWYTLVNEATGNGHYLAADGSAAEVREADRKTDRSVHWTLVREKGSRLPFAIGPDSVCDASFLGMRTARALSADEIVSDYHGQGNRWKRTRDLSGLPAFSAPGYPMLAALYNLALEEMLLDIRTDSTFMAGALWPDTWTRDAVYSIYFSYAWILPEVSRKTLDKQTLREPSEALQDTGSGGSWPISTDRVVWAMAGWEYYLSSGDTAWLAGAYEGLKQTAHKDIHVAFDEKAGLFKGETCSMDWRTHTYPNWFTNASIGESFSAGTNALHLFMYDFLGKAGQVLGKPSAETAEWNRYHQRVKEGINRHFWNEEAGMYRCYLYPEFMGYRPSQRVGVMSNGLCALLGAASPAQVSRMVAAFPQYPYGAAVLYPTIPDDFAYHNKSVWPVWETPFMYAAHRVGNQAAAEHVMRSLIRQSALFLTHKENMTYDTGYDRNTALNSDRQLWSVSAYISMVYRVLFGLEMSESGLSFRPAVPSWVNGPLELKGFRYRKADVDLYVDGQGSKIKSLTCNGQVQSLPFVLPPDASGKQQIRIVLEPDAERPGEMNLVEAGPGKCWSPVEPVLVREGNRIRWEEERGVAYYLYGNGESRPVTSPVDLSGERPGYYAVYGVNAKGYESDLSNPVLVSLSASVYEAEEAVFRGKAEQKFSGYSGNGYVLDRLAAPQKLHFTIDLPEAGDYVLTLRGANGFGPDGVYCAIRSVFVDGKDVGTFILEASGRWDKWTESNHLVLEELPAGKHTVALDINPEGKGFDSNMSRGKANVNDCAIDYLQVVRVR